jgi:hypothetical protein
MIPGVSMHWLAIGEHVPAKKTIKIKTSMVAETATSPHFIQTRLFWACAPVEASIRSSYHNRSALD